MRNATKTESHELKRENARLKQPVAEATKAFIDYYDYRCYHEGLGDITPCDVYTDRHLEIKKRKE